MEVKLIRYTRDSEELAGMAATVCTRSDNWEKALKTALKSGHESVLEHITFTFEISGISRITLAQLTRHRLASYSVESQRYVSQAEQDYVMPESIRMDDTTNRIYRLAMVDAKELYERLISMGVPQEDARYCLPQSFCTRLYMTANARELLHFFSLRCCERAQWEIRELALRMLRLCIEVCPVIFENAGPGCVRGHCPEAKPCRFPWIRNPEKTHCGVDGCDIFGGSDEA